MYVQERIFTQLDRIIAYGSAMYRNSRYTQSKTTTVKFWKENFMPKRCRKSLNRTTYTRSKAFWKQRRKGRRVQYLVKWLGYAESFNSWIFKQDLSKQGVAVWSVSLANGTECHGEHIVLGRLWIKDTSIGDRISVSGTHPVHGWLAPSTTYSTALWY